ncbi:hypothetical protein ACFV9C_42965 [Kribbella sp. NPDC059898]|uniref:hypothetical protein n=1 Tax=Kribbella sp. NPDC059898 TaxID=3346995 RepID=UPI003652C471
MDPNETLAMIRALVSSQLELECGGELAELVQALDEWMSGGGFLPHDWQVHWMRIGI